MAILFNTFIGLDIAFVGAGCHDLAGNKGYVKKVKMFNKNILPLVIVFLITAGLIFMFKEFLQLHEFDWKVLSAGNIFVYLVTAVSMNMLGKGLNAPDTNAFLRNAYGAILIKLFACAGAAFIYILAAGKNLNTPALFACMFLYLVYTSVELSVIMKQSNAKRNVKN